MKELAGYIDHTLLKADVTKGQIEQLCDEAIAWNFASVCVNPAWVQFAAERLNGSDVKVCTVIGFPLGANTPETKAFETKDAIRNGAQEVDMVLNIGALKQGELEQVASDIRAVTEAASGKASVKVIIETALLTDEEKRAACVAAKSGGADFVKTSTGFSNGGATAGDVKLMKEAVDDELKVKASGGIRTYEDMKNMLDAGADRIGASSGVQILEGAK